MPALPAPKTFDIIFPLPPKALSPNFSKSWRIKAKAKDEYKAICTGILMKAKLPPSRFLSYSVEFFMCKQPSYYYKCCMRGCRSWKKYSAPGICIKCSTQLCKKNADPNAYFMDIDNAIGSLKYLQDCFKDVGIIPNDSSTYCKITDVILHRTKLQHLGKTELLVHITLQAPIPTAKSSGSGLR